MFICVIRTSVGELVSEDGAGIVFKGDAGELEVPPDVAARGFRMEMKYGRNRHEYMAQWCNRELCKVEVRTA